MEIKWQTVLCLFLVVGIKLLHLYMRHNSTVWHVQNFLALTLLQHEDSSTKLPQLPIALTNHNRYGPWIHFYKTHLKFWWQLNNIAMFMHIYIKHPPTATFSFCRHDNITYSKCKYINP